ncbi:MAG: calcium/sodium antiporter [Phyllobacteriaceae bacterium]|nr:calcium/sodium antiporter [Phyllobacteriaceae bacterium]
MDFLLVLLGLALLFAGGEGLVRGAVAMAERLGVSKLVIGLTIVGMGTSFPELLVSLRAALAGSSDIAIGNVVGSNISNVLVILAVAALVAPIAGWNGNVKRDALFGVAGAFLLMLLGFSGGIGRFAGFAMVAILAVYLYYVYRQEQVDPPPLVDHFDEEVHERLAPRLAVAFVLGGLTLLFAGAEALVSGAVSIAQSFGLSERVIGLTIVAIGTSLPEMAASVAAAKRGHTDVAIGNIAGSNAFNTLGILGLSSIIRPMAISPGMAAIDIPLMTAVLAGLAAMVFKLKVLTRNAGLAMLGVYALYVGVLLAI